MRLIIVLLSLGLSLGSYGSDRLTGEWKLVGMLYQGKEISLPNPHLHLTWTFFKNGTERLYWDRGGPEFCERFAFYSLDSGFLKEKTFALNPENAAECSKDPDMQVGKETQTKIECSSVQIKLTFQLGDDELVYILKHSQSPWN